MARLALMVLMAAIGWAEPHLYFSKDFPGSQPAYVSISCDQHGACEYKEAADDDRPLKLQLAETEVATLFQLADKLDRFSRPLESPLKVAKMGMKTFRFEDGDKKSEVQFNFSEDLDARALADWFERISETGQLYYSLERTVKYDKLGVNQSLMHLETCMSRGRLVSGQLFLPLLDRVVKNDAYLNLARNRASGLAAMLRGAK
jgi:hypothetical protein